MQPRTGGRPEYTVPPPLNSQFNVTARHWYIVERKLKVEAGRASASDGVKTTAGTSNDQFVDETYMSSAEWLKRHGLIARRLGFYDVLASVAFRHEDGVLDLKVAPPCGDDEVVDAVSKCSGVSCMCRWLTTITVSVTLCNT